MADSIRQQIIDNVLARLATITVANGYETDLGDNVFEWRDHNLAESELPACVVRDDEEIKEDGAFGYKDHELALEIELFTDSDGSNSSPKIMRKLLADVIKAVGTDDTWDVLAAVTRVTSSRMEHNHEEREFAGAFVNLEIQYTTKMWDPYTQGP